MLRHFGEPSRTKAYLLSIFFLSILSQGTVPAQEQTERQTEKWPSVEVQNPPDSPLLITLYSVEGSQDSYRIIHFTIQNVSQKKVMAYALAVGPGNGPRGNIASMSSSFFAPGRVTQEQIRQEKVNSRNHEKYIISADYVFFDDSTGWGPDSNGFSSQIKGFYEGRQAVLEKVSEMLNKREDAALVNLLRTDVEKLEPAERTEGNWKWQRGFGLGYRSVMRSLQEEFKRGGIDAVEIWLSDLK